MRKHIVQDISELIEIKDQLTEKVSFSENMENTILNKQNEIDVVTKKLDHISNIIHEKRREIIPKLVVQLEKILQDLGMPNAQFKIEIVFGEPYLSNGKDELSFLFSFRIDYLLRTDR